MDASSSSFFPRFSRRTGIIAVSLIPVVVEAVIVVVAVDSNGRLIREPELITRGLVHVDASQEMLAELRTQLADNLPRVTGDRVQLQRHHRREPLARFRRARRSRLPVAATWAASRTSPGRLRVPTSSLCPFEVDQERP